MPPRTRYVSTRDGRSIAWSTVGDGPIDLLYVPQSISAMEHIWDHPRVARFFAQIAGFSRLILFDRRGSGMSERMEEPASLEEQMDDVHAVLDAAGAEKAAVAALYEGGSMAMLFAASAPERVTHLVLYATYARATWAPDYPWARTKEVRDAAMDVLRDNWGTGAGFIEGFATNHADDKALQDWLGRMQRLAMDPNYGRRMGDVNGRTDVRHVLSSIRVPTLVMHRADDAGFDVRHSRYLAEHIPGARYIELDGDDSLPMFGDADTIVGEIEEFLTGTRREAEPDRVLATVLFTDIVRARIERHRGRAVKSMGDGVLATFDGPARGIRAARGIVDDLAGIGVEVRAGLHTGECEVIESDVGGLAVHIAARVMGEAQPREVLVSSTVRDLVVGSGLEFEERGERELRGIPDRWRLWAVA